MVDRGEGLVCSTKRVISAFFADRTAIRDQKLQVWGGVWDWYAVSELPFTAPIQLAVIAQLGSDDRQKTRTLAASMKDTAGAEVARLNVRCEIAHDNDTEHMCLAITLAPTFATTGRHVMSLHVDDNVDDAFVLPLSVRVNQ